MLKTLIALAGALSLIVAACTNPEDSNSEPSPPTGSIALDAYCDSLETAVAAAEECLGETLDFDRAKCEANDVSSVSAGTSTYDGVEAAACMALVSDCKAFVEQILVHEDEANACTRMFVGTVAPGGECYEDHECLDGECYFTDDACPGHCRAKARGGESCSEASCAPGLICDWDTMTCGHGLAEGETCGESPCAEGLKCTEGTCVRIAIAELGEGCDRRNGVVCLPSLYCDASSKCAARIESGGGCDPEADDTGCVSDALCHPETAKCVATAVGDDCVPFDGYSRCARLECDEDTGKCVEYEDTAPACVRP